LVPGRAQPPQANIQQQGTPRLNVKPPQKLIEVALPLDDINAAAARETSNRHGHPSTPHLNIRAATLLGLFLSASAHADGRCSKPSEPSIPSGYVADEAQMERAQEVVQAYLEEVKKYKQCLVENIEEVEADAKDVVDAWNDAVKDYSAR
jgi:hypothetical protein